MKYPPGVPLHFMVKLRGSWWVMYETPNGPKLAKKPYGGPHSSRADGMDALGQAPQHFTKEVNTHAITDDPRSA